MAEAEEEAELEGVCTGVFATGVRKSLWELLMANFCWVESANGVASFFGSSCLDWQFNLLSLKLLFDGRSKCDLSSEMAEAGEEAELNGVCAGVLATGVRKLLWELLMLKFCWVESANGVASFFGSSCLD